VAREYTIYKLVAPSGDCYIGFTSMPVKERWRCHIDRAFIENYDSPLYEAIRKFGPGNFNVLEVKKTSSLTKAQQLERHYIKNAPKEFLFNLSPGGNEDASFGGKVFWKRLNANPQAREAYLRKLSEVKKSRDWTDYEALVEASLKWRKKNPRQAYKASYRAIRIANRGKPKSEVKHDDRPLKERLMWKHKRNEMTRKNALASWAKRTEEEKAKIAQKISAKQKERMKDIAVLPDFQQNEWPYAKATVLRKIRQGMNRDEIINDAVENVKNKGSHWRDVKRKLEVMGVEI